MGKKKISRGKGSPGFHFLLFGRVDCASSGRKKASGFALRFGICQTRAVLRRFVTG